MKRTQDTASLEKTARSSQENTKIIKLLLDRLLMSKQEEEYWYGFMHQRVHGTWIIPTTDKKKDDLRIAFIIEVGRNENGLFEILEDRLGNSNLFVE